MSNHTNEKRYLLHIELKDLKPKIWREVIVPESISLTWLHEVIQEAMGWMDTHLHQFEHQNTFYAPPATDDWEETEDASTVALNQLLKRTGSKLNYVYDFGDDWRHTIRLKKVLPPDPNELLRCLAGDQACPPEDCGGIPGYLEFCELRLAKKRGATLSEDEVERLEWFDFFADEEDSFDANEMSGVNEAFQKILAHALPKGGLGIKGAPVSAGIFKAHEMDDDEDDDFEELFSALTGGHDPLDSARQEEDGDEEEAPESPEPYSDLSPADLARFRSAMMLAQDVRKREPWKRLYDSDLFGIEDPETGEIAIVSVLGANKEVFALHVHRWPYGFRFWEHALMGPESTLPAFIMQHSSIIEVQFKNKSELEEPDLQLYEKIDFETPKKGRNQWMSFRNYRPRALPWFPKASDLDLLITGLLLIPRYLEALAAAPEPEDFLFSTHRQTGLPSTMQVFQLMPCKNTDDAPRWQLKEAPIDWKLPMPEEAPFQPSEFELHELAHLPKSKEQWEMGTTVFPNPVMTEEGPVLPLLALAVDTSMQQPPVPYLTAELEVSPTQALWNCLQERALEAGSIPAEIHVGTDAAQATLLGLQKIAGVRIVRKDDLEFLSSLFESMNQMPPPEL